MPNKKATRNNASKKSKHPVIPKIKKQTLYYFNGSTFPMFKIADTYDYFNKQSVEMIKMGIKTGVSKEEQIQDYKNQLSMIETLLYQHCNPYSEQGMKFICEFLEEKEEKIYIVWCLNICALLNLNALTNDNDNGVLHLSGNALKNFNSTFKKK